MSHREPVPSFTADELQRKCDECKAAIASQDDLRIRRAMERVCDHCKVVREHLPELAELRRHIHEMNEKADKHSIVS